MVLMVCLFDGLRGELPAAGQGGFARNMGRPSMIAFTESAGVRSSGPADFKSDQAGAAARCAGQRSESLKVALKTKKKHDF